MPGVRFVSNETRDGHGLEGLKGLEERGGGGRGAEADEDFLVVLVWRRGEGEEEGALGDG